MDTHGKADNLNLAHVMISLHRLNSRSSHPFIFQDEDSTLSPMLKKLSYVTIAFASDERKQYAIVAYSSAEYEQQLGTQNKPVNDNNLQSLMCTLEQSRDSLEYSTRRK
jgi:hypothetical protein